MGFDLIIKYKDKHSQKFKIKLKVYYRQSELRFLKIRKIRQGLLIKPIHLSINSIPKMNRFRQLKQKLIKSKRDSQKLQQSPFSQTQLEDWVQKQLEYYGISKDSYRLRELKNFSQNNNSLQQISKHNPEHQSSKDSNHNDNHDKPNAFVKKVNSYEGNENISNFQNDMSFGQQSGIASKQSKQHEPNSSNNQTASQPTSKRLICKKPKNCHVSSMNDAQKIIQASSKENLPQLQQEQNHFKNLFKSCQPQQKQSESSSPHKQLDYYTLILQLTAELNYSRINKETSNEKSILNQIKNLISFIQGKSATEPGTEPSAEQSSNAKINLNSQNSHHHTNIKSNHTFSSVFSNQSIANQIDHEKSAGSSEKRKIKYKLIGKQNAGENESQNRRLCTEPISSQRNEYQDEHNETFQSINAFEENDEQDDQEDKTSIIDMVNDQQFPAYREDIFIQESEDNQNSVMENSPLSRITQRQSQYTSSANPSIHVSPSKYTAEKFVKTSEKLQIKFLPDVMEKHIESLYAENIFKKKPSEKQPSSNGTKMLPQNQMILKKLSDRFENSEEPLHLFQQSIEYKRILYMLDSEYASSDYKNRTFSSLFGQKSSSTLNQGGSDKESNQYSIKGASQGSAKSFAKQIFESDGSYTKQNHTRESPCLMSKLDNLFKTECQKESSSPKLLHFSSQNQLESKYNEKENHFAKKNHKRSQTAKESLSNEAMNKTIKYKFNVLSELSQQINEESEENPFDNNKYEPMRTEYNEEDSVYHKVSRQSYLTSSSAQNSNEPTSSEGECMDGNKKIMRKGNLIVKKSKRSDQYEKSQKENFSNLMMKSSDEDKLQKSMKFVVKKNPSQKMGHKNSQQQFIQDMSKNTSDLFSKRPDTQQVIFISMSDEATSRVDKRSSKSIHSHQSSSSLQSSNQKPDEDVVYTNNKVRSPSLNQSKVSLNSSNRPIKYKVYGGPSEFQPIQQKQDKRKVLKDIVSVLNSKYNRNIKLKQ